MLCSLSYGAVGCASSAFNDGETELSDQLAQFAVRVFPEVKKSLPWTRLQAAFRVERMARRAAGRRYVAPIDVEQEAPDELIPAVFRCVGRAKYTYRGAPQQRADFGGRHGNE
jgi:hypothetical protein